MTNNKPIVYIVFRTNAGPTSTRFGGFITRLKKTGHMPDATYIPVALEDLTFTIDQSGYAAIYDTAGNEQFSDATLVYFKSWEVYPEQASMIVSFLRAKGIPFEDAAVGHAGVHKPSQTWKFWSQGVDVIPTVSSFLTPSHGLIERVLGPGPYIVKPAKGEKGKGIVKADSYEELVTHITSQPQAWLVQPYISNDGDYRVLTYGYQVRGALYRQGVNGAIVNNTSQGASSMYLHRKEVPIDVRRAAVAAARAVEYAVAGVDVMIGPDGVARVLEANQGSQIVTGHSVQEKMAAFGDFLSERMPERYTRSQPNNRLPVIGRYVHVNLPELAAKNVFAKVDTGAYQSSIHATDISEVETENGKVLEFTILDGHSGAEGLAKTSRVDEYEKVVVRNSFGVKQTRYVIKTRISINGRMMKTGLTLADRKDMVAPILLGRRFIRGRYLVNVEINEKGIVEGE